jgi:hypothetical protein
MNTPFEQILFENITTKIIFHNKNISTQNSKDKILLNSHLWLTEHLYVKPL